MRTRKINRLWNGLASLRDYEVESFKKEGGVVLICDNERMTLTKEMLQDCGFQTNKNSHKSKDPNWRNPIHGGDHYHIYDYKWIKDKK